MFYNSYTSRREINTANIWRPPGKILCNIKEDSEPTVRVNLSVGSVSGVWRFVLFYFQRWWRRYTSGTRKSQTPGKLPEIVKTPGTLISRYLHICAPWPLLIEPRCRSPPPAVKERSDWSSAAKYECRLPKFNRLQRGTSNDSLKLIVGSEVRVPTPQSQLWLQWSEKWCFFGPLFFMKLSML